MGDDSSKLLQAKKPLMWNVLTESLSGPLVLAVDFPATGRLEAGFADLAANSRIGAEMWETRPVAGAHGADEFVTAWLGDVPTGRPVSGVLGYCAGAVFAAAVVERIARRQATPPALVVFDPERPDAEILQWQYHKLLQSLHTVLPPEEIAAAQEAAASARRDSADAAELAGHLRENFAVVAPRAFARAGLDTRHSAELGAAFHTFLDYLVAATRIDPTPVWATATAISSSTPRNGLNVLDPAERATAVRRELRFDVPHGELLSHPDVAAAAADLLR